MEGNETPFVYLPTCILAGRRRTYCLGVLTLGDGWAALAGLCESLDGGCVDGHQRLWVRAASARTTIPTHVLVFGQAAMFAGEEGDSCLVEQVCAAHLCGPPSLFPLLAKMEGGGGEKPHHQYGFRSSSK